jgi:hypothetical protein
VIDQTTQYVQTLLTIGVQTEIADRTNAEPADRPES